MIVIVVERRTSAPELIDFGVAYIHVPRSLRMSDFNEFNRGIVAEFRERGGVVGGPFEGAPMILVNHRGAKSGKDYTSPLVYTRDGDSYVIIASKGGAPEDPQWFRNLVAHPDVTVEVGTDTVPVRARVAEGDERDPALPGPGRRHAELRRVRQGDDPGDPGRRARADLTSRRARIGPWPNGGTSRG